MLSKQARHEMLELMEERAEEADEEIDRLNQMLRDTGYGQGQIDAYVAQCEEVERLRAIVDKVVEADGRFKAFAKVTDVRKFESFLASVAGSSGAGSSGACSPLNSLIDAAAVIHDAAQAAEGGA